MLELASSRLLVPDPVLNHWQQVLYSANESLDSIEGEYEGNDAQREVREESEKENELSQHRDDTDPQLAWRANRPISREPLSSQHSILSINLGNTKISCTMITYPGRRMPAPVQVSQNGYISPIPSCSPTALKPPRSPGITPSHPEPTMLHLNSRGRPQASRRGNSATRLERSILARACELMWDGTIFVNPFPDPIILT